MRALASRLARGSALAEARPEAIPESSHPVILGAASGVVCFMGTNRTHTSAPASDRSSWHSPTRARLALCYGFLQGKWPFGLVEAIWASAAVYHWRQRAKHAQRPARRKCPVNVMGNPVREVVRIAGCQEARPVQAASAAGRFQTGPAGQPFLNGCPGRPATFTRML